MFAIKNFVDEGMRFGPNSTGFGDFFLSEATENPEKVLLESES
jgi:hypothetical protein